MSDRSPLRVAVFDLDGTLVDSRKVIVATMGAAFSGHGLEAPADAAVARVVGLPLEGAIARLAPHLDAPDHAVIAQRYKDAFFALRQAGEHIETLFPGVEDTLDALEAEGWLLGIATSKSMKGLRASLETFGLERRFVTLQTGDTGPGKPAPDMLLRAVAEAGAEPDTAVMIGDTSYDMEMARAARVRGIGVGWGCHEAEELLAAGAIRVVTNCAELRGAVSSLPSALGDIRKAGP